MKTEWVGVWIWIIFSLEPSNFFKEDCYKLMYLFCGGAGPRMAERRERLGGMRERKHYLGGWRRHMVQISSWLLHIQTFKLFFLFYILLSFSVLQRIPGVGSARSVEWFAWIFTWETALPPCLIITLTSSFWLESPTFLGLLHLKKKKKGVDLHYF